MTRGPPPELSAQQQMLLDLVAEMWRASSTWPKRKQLRFKLEKQNCDFDGVYKSIPRGLLSDYDSANEENARVRLTVAGLERAKDGTADTTPFVQFVLTGVKRYMAARSPITISTREEGLLADRKPEERQRLLELFKLDWSGGYALEAGADWRTDITFAHLRFSDIHTAWEYIERQWEGAPHIAELSAHHVSLLAEVYALRRATSVWPLAREFMLAHAQPWQVFRLLEEIASTEKPRLLNRFSPAENEQHNTRLRMTIDGVAIVAPTEADDFARVLHALAHLYAETEGQEEVPPEEITQRTGFTLKRLNDLQELFEDQYETGVSFFRRQDGFWAFALRSQVATWRSCSTFAEYRARRDKPAEAPAMFEQLRAALFTAGGAPARRIELPNGDWYIDESTVLGKGGTSTVYAGHDANGKPLAIKRLVGNGLRELKIADHIADRPAPFLLQPLDAGQDESTGELFIVLPRAEKDLEKHIEGRVVPEQEALAILEDVARGLEDLGGVVHRDLKPSNILFMDGRWLISDFGVARIVAEATSKHTMKDWRTAVYAAPEQWRHERATPGTDVYAFGCIAFELLTGHPPFEGSEEELAAKHQRDSPPDLECSPRTRALVASCLRKNSAGRPSVIEIRADIVRARAEQGLPVMSPEDQLLAEAGAIVARRRAEDEKRALDARAELSSREVDISDTRADVRGMLQQLVGDISDKAPGTRLLGGAKVELGTAMLAYSEVFSSSEPFVLPLSHWELFAGFLVTVWEDSDFSVSCNLWFVRRPSEVGPAWLECALLSQNPPPVPFGLGSLQSESDVTKLDLAARGGASRVFAEDPAPLDRAQFVAKWKRRFALAAQQKLRSILSSSTDTSPRSI